jgi:hypothetical protein
METENSGRGTKIKKKLSNSIIEIVKLDKKTNFKLTKYT